MPAIASTSPRAARRASPTSRSNDYDVVFSDVHMPDMDGLAFYRNLKDLKPELAGRLILVTGDTLGGGIQSFLEETGLPFLEKPFMPAEVRGSSLRRPCEMAVHRRRPRSGGSRRRGPARRSLAPRRKCRPERVAAGNGGGDCDCHRRGGWISFCCKMTPARRGEPAINDKTFNREARRQ